MKQPKNNSFWAPIRNNSIKVVAWNPLFDFPKNSHPKPIANNNIKSINFFGAISKSKIKNHSINSNPKHSFALFVPKSPQVFNRKIDNKLFNSPKKFKPISVVKSNINVPKKQMNWFEAKSKYPKLNPFKDADRDGVINMLDCKPFNKAMQDAKSRAYFKKLREDKNNLKIANFPKETREFIGKSIGENVDGGFAKLINNPKIQEELRKIREEREKEAFQIRKRALKTKIKPKDTRANIAAIRAEKKRYEKDFEESDRQALKEWDKKLLNSQLKESLRGDDFKIPVVETNRPVVPLTITDISEEKKEKHVTTLADIQKNNQILEPSKTIQPAVDRRVMDAVKENRAPEMKKEIEKKQERAIKRESLAAIREKEETKRIRIQEKAETQRQLDKERIKLARERVAKKREEQEALTLREKLRKTKKLKFAEVQKFKAETRAVTRGQIAQLDFAKAQIKSQASLGRSFAAIKGGRGLRYSRKEPDIDLKNISAKLDEYEKRDPMYIKNNEEDKGSKKIKNIIDEKIEKDKKEKIIEDDIELRSIIDEKLPEEEYTI